MCFSGTDGAAEKLLSTAGFHHHQKDVCKVNSPVSTPDQGAALEVESVPGRLPTASNTKIG